MAAEKQRKTFLSYSRVNKDFAIRLAKELKTEGFDIWLDQLDIPAGSRWDREVEKALRESEIFMIILTPASVDSENVLDEIGYAIDNGKRFLPVLLEKSDVPLRLRRFQYVDFTNKNFDEGVESAKDLLRSLIAQPTIPRAEFTGSQVQEAARKAKEETDRLAAQKTDEEQLAKEKAEMDRRVKEEAERLFAQKAEEERLAKASAEAERKAKTEARRKAKEESDRLAAQKAEEERLVKQKAGEEQASKAQVEKEEAEYLAAQKVEADRLASQNAQKERLAKQKADEEVAAKARVDKERKDKEESDRLIAQKAEVERLAKQKADEEVVAKAKAEKDRKAKEEADRLATQKAQVEQKTKEKSASTEMKATPVFVAAPQKKPVSKGLLIGACSTVAVVVFAIAVLGINAFMNGKATAIPTDPNQAAEIISVSPTVNKVSNATNTPKPSATARPTKTPNLAETKVYEGYNTEFQNYSKQGYITAANGSFIEHSDFSFETTKYVAQTDSMYSKDITDFYISSHFIWSIPKEEKDAAGCGVFFASQQNGDGYMVFLEDSRIYFAYSKGSYYYEVGKTRGTGRVNFSSPAEANFTLIVNGYLAYVIVNDELIGEYSLAKSYPLSGQLYLGVWGSATLKNVSCEMSNLHAWIPQ